MAEGDCESSSPMPTLDELQHWTFVLGRTQQLMLEHAAAAMTKAPPPPVDDLVKAQADLWNEGLAFWQAAIGAAKQGGPEAPAPAANTPPDDKRFAAPEWQANAFFDVIRQSYLLVSEQLLETVETMSGIDEEMRRKLRFGTQAFLDAVAPTNFALTNPLVVQKTLETKGDNLVRGLELMLRDLARGQITHSNPEAFEIGRNLAATPGKVVKRTPLYELIQYAPATDTAIETPLLIFPPWINRFYILDLNPKKSFIKWAVDQGLTVFLLSWRSADESLAGTTMTDYVLAQVEAMDTVRDLIGTRSVHTIGYCVAGTTLAATLGYLAARGEADKVAGATFFAAQVDFSSAGDLSLFVGDEQLELVRQLSATKGYLDGRYMAATFNLLRGRDLIWNYVVNSYLMGEEAPPFDLLHWNGDTTNLPATWHQSYLTQLYRENQLIEPGGIVINGVPIDLRQVTTPAYVQASREDHIAPAESVWKITHHLSGPMRFVLAGSGHIAGVINPPSSGKYGYWTNEAEVETLSDFVKDAQETKGSWWPDWCRWLEAISPARVPVSGARIPGQGSLEALADAPGDYVKQR